jgi:hypothetical protein
MREDTLQSKSTKRIIAANFGLIVLIFCTTIFILLARKNEDTLFGSWCEQLATIFGM